MDEPEDIVEEVPKVDPVLPSHPAGGGGGEVRPAEATAATGPEAKASPDSPAEGTSNAALEPAPRLYRLRPPGLRPAPRPRRGRIDARLRNDCPPENREGNRPETRARLR